MNISDASTEPVWRLVELWVEPHCTELVSDVLWSHGVSAVEEIESSSHVVLRTSTVLPEESLAELPGVVRVVHVDIARSVADTWRRYAEPVPIADGVAVVPAWKPKSWPRDKAVLIEPGDAFGAGNHPSTRLAARLLMEFSSPGQSLFDLGCGTGVLAILVARHRGCHAHAWDIAPGCRSLVEANCALNGLTEEQVRWQTPGSKHDYDIVVANILAPVLRAEKYLIHGMVRAGGFIILSGMREDQIDDVVDVYGLEARATQIEDGWIAVALQSR